MSRKVIDIGDRTVIEVRQLRLREASKVKGWGWNSHVYRWKVRLPSGGSIKGEARGATTAFYAAVRYAIAAAGHK